MTNTKVEADNTADVKIANRILLAMLNRDVSLTELSERADITYTTLRRSLHQSRKDRRSFSIQQLYKVAEVLEVPPSALVPEPIAA